MALTFYLTLRTVANVLLDGQFWKKDASVYSFNLRILVHPFCIKYHSLLYLTICNRVCCSHHHLSLCHVKPNHI